MIAQIFTFYILLRLVSTQTSEERLFELIKSKSSPLFPPPSPKSGLEVAVNKLYLRNIEEINESRGQVIQNLGVGLEWRNPTLSWNPKDYFDTPCLTFARENSVWAPKLSFFTNFYWQKKSFEDDEITVCHDGMHYFYTGKIVGVQTFFDPQNFPFDEHWVESRFGLSFAPSSKPPVIVYGTNRTIKHRDYARNLQQWRVVSGLGCSVETDNGEKVFDYMVNVTALNCRFQVKRAGIYYVWQFVLPTGLVTILAVIGFFLASLKSTKHSSVIGSFHLGGTLLMSMGVMSLTIVATVPQSPVLIRIELYYYAQLLLIFAAAVIFGSLSAFSGSKLQKPGVNVAILSLFIVLFLSNLIWFLSPIIF